MKYDVVIIGGGIVGLATAYRFLEQRPRPSILVVEKEPALATHQTGHNSGVVHAGIYYAPGSLKARLCVEGKTQLERFATAHGIPIEHPGKLVVAVDESEIGRLETLRERAEANGIPGVAIVGVERMREIEPHVHGVRGLWSPRTAIIDFRQVALACAEEVRARGGSIVVSTRVTGLRRQPRSWILETTGGAIESRTVITCAGLYSDRVAEMADGPDRTAPRIVPFRGDYYALTDVARRLVRGLIYPVPDPRFPFLGVHFTRRIDGAVWAGPNAVLAFAREGYRRRDVSLRDLGASLTYPGFLRLAARYPRTGLAELWRDISKGAFLASLHRLVPEITASDLLPGPSGVRAQAVHRDGSLADDFVIGGSDRILHVRNAPSPAATSSLAIGRILAEAAIERFGL